MFKSHIKVSKVSDVRGGCCWPPRTHGQENPWKTNCPNVNSRTRQNIALSNKGDKGLKGEIRRGIKRGEKEMEETSLNLPHTSENSDFPVSDQGP